MIGEQKKISNQLLTERSNHLAKISELNDEVTLLNSQHEQVKKQVGMMTTDSGIPDEMSQGQDKGRANGIGFDYEPLNQKQRNRKFAYASEDHGMIRKEKQDKDIKIIDPSGTDVASTSKTMLKPPQEHLSDKNKKTTRPWICHHCKRKGHKRPFCYKLYGYPKQSDHKSSQSEMRNVKKEWMPKSNNVGLMVHTSQKPSSIEVWYFNSGCSRHMTGVNSFFENIRFCDSGYVTFGDGGKGKILGIGKLISDEIPKLENVFLVEGLFSNLISISQLCDQGMEVNFNKSGCQVTNEEGKLLMRGIRTKNKCYKWVPQLEEHNGRQTRMLCTMLEHYKILSLPNFGSRDERRSVTERSFTVKNNQINVQLHSIKDSVEKNIVSTEDI